MQKYSNSKLETVGKQIKSITYLGLAVNVSLAAVKIVIGFFAGSLALIADGIHSLSDLITDVAVLLGVRLGSKAPDQSHPYGHGRAETLSAGLIALVLIIVGLYSIYCIAAPCFATPIKEKITPTCLRCCMSVCAIIN